MALYRELSATASAASLSSARLSIGPPSDMSSSRMGPVEEVLGSYRHSFAGLSSAVHTLAAELQARTLSLFGKAPLAMPSSHLSTNSDTLYLSAHVQDDELRCSFAASQPAPLPGRFPSTTDALRSSTSGSGNPFAHVLQTSAPGTLDGPPSSSVGPMGGREAFPQDGSWVARANVGQGGNCKKPTSADAAGGPPAELLEKYSDLLMKLVERKVDDMLLSKSQTRL